MLPPNQLVEGTMIVQFSPDAHRQLVDGMARHHTECAEDPATVRAMQIVLNLPKIDPPTHEELLADAARATIALCLGGEFRDELEEWYNHRIRKVTRRARNKPWCDAEKIAGVTVGRARAIAPGRVDEVPRPIAKLQVKGTDADRGGEPRPIAPSAPLIVVDGSLGMTTGKSAAQVGHAAMFYAASLATGEAAAWAADDYPVGIRVAEHSEFLADAARTGAVIVRDAGFTEVPAGAATALALPPAV